MSEEPEVRVPPPPVRPDSPMPDQRMTALCPHPPVDEMLNGMIEVIECSNGTPDKVHFTIRFWIVDPRTNCYRVLNELGPVKSMILKYPQETIELKRLGESKKNGT